MQVFWILNRMIYNDMIDFFICRLNFGVFRSFTFIFLRSLVIFSIINYCFWMFHLHCPVISYLLLFGLYGNVYNFWCCSNVVILVLLDFFTLSYYTIKTMVLPSSDLFSVFHEYGEVFLAWRSMYDCVKTTNNV